VRERASKRGRRSLTRSLSHSLSLSLSLFSLSLSLPYVCISEFSVDGVVGERRRSADFRFPRKSEGKRDAMVEGLPPKDNILAKRGDVSFVNAANPLRCNFISITRILLSIFYSTLPSLCPLAIIIHSSCTCYSLDILLRPTSISVSPNFCFHYPDCDGGRSHLSIYPRDHVFSRSRICYSREMPQRNVAIGRIRC
jgi:hypothetical protein